MKKIILFACCFIIIQSTKATIVLPAVLSSNMVLQQQSTVKLWGWGNPLEKIVITTSWNNAVDSTVVQSDASWQLNIKTVAAGGPYNITIKGANTIVLENVMLGEVWVCSGQSNMEMTYGWGIPGMKEELKDSFNKNIRFFAVSKASSAFVQDDCKGNWTTCDSNSVKAFSAAAYFFAKKLNGKLNIPIGIIGTYWGATAAEVWTPANSIDSNARLKEAALNIYPNQWCPVKPGCVYNTMIAPLLNYKIAGATWYQGESNTETAGTYDLLLKTMIASWRNAWHTEIPFYFVQIAPFSYGKKDIGALLREAQTKVMEYPYTGMVVTNDLVTDTTDIHPKNKRDVGYRLANWALAETYHQQGIDYKSPQFKNMDVKKDKAVISFDNAMAGIVSKDKMIKSIFIAGADKMFYPAEAKIDHDKLIVWSNQVKQPVAVRYAFSNAGIGNLEAKGGLPVCPFRTDDW
jgi:sialate O-acetylesterase